MSEKEVQQKAIKAAEFESEEFTFQDDEQRARYYKVLSEGYKTLWMDEVSKSEEVVRERDALRKALTTPVLKLVDELRELEDTLGLRNRSNPDLTIDEEKPKSLFERWQNLED